MLDYRHQTFLALCTIRNYTKTAEYLHITQPAVTQHIQYLEEMYNAKLIIYQNKKLELTIQGEKLRDLLTRIAADTTHFKRNLEKTSDAEETFYFGATLSIGEYLMPDILINILQTNPELHIHMEVGNTKVLLDKLWNGEIDFAILEGIFDKSKYQAEVFCVEKFIPVCSSNSTFTKKTIDFKEVINSPLVLREKGSGTREILENILIQYNYSINSFKNTIEIGNMSAIKKLVANNIGITFLYEMVAKKEIEQGGLAKINIAGFNETREFNFVFLKNSLFKDKYLEYFKMMKESYLYNYKK